MLASVSFEMGWEDLDVEALGDGLYRLDSNPSPFTETDLEFGDIFEGAQEPDGMLRLIRVVDKSLWKHYCWVLHKQTFETRAFGAFARQAKEADAFMEIVMGGIFIVHVPAGSIFDAEAAWLAAFDTYGTEPADESPLKSWHFSTTTGYADLQARFGN